MSGSKANSKDGKDDKKTQAAMNDMGKLIDSLEKKVSSLSKLHDEASKEPDPKVMKQMQTQVEALSKLVESIEKSHKEVAATIK